MEVLLHVAADDDRRTAEDLIGSLGAPPDGDTIRVVGPGDHNGEAPQPEPDLLPLVTIDGTQVVVGRLPSAEEFQWLLDNAPTAQALARGETPQQAERFSVPRRIHINMHVHDLDQALAFYEVLLGAKPSKRLRDYAKFELEDPPVNLALEQVRPEVDPKIDHMGIEVKSAEAVLEHRARYLQAGFKLTEELNVECCYAVQNKIWAIDPKGLRWEVVNVVGDIQSDQACPPDCICWQEFDESDRSIIATPTTGNGGTQPASASSGDQGTAEHVRQVYETTAQAGQSGLCCDPSTMYSPEELAALPEEARALSSGCGNPLRFSAIQPGQTVVDIGSGAGSDALLAARLTGPEGRVVGVDPSPSMRDRAAKAAADLRLGWVTFAEGTAEQLPLADGSADVVLSNCVLSMSTDPAAVWAEVARVLRPGGMFVVSDTVGAAAADTPEARARCEVGLSWPAYLDQFQRAGLGSIRLLEAGTVQYRDGNRVQSATFAGRRRNGPGVAVQLFLSGATTLAERVGEQLAARGVTAEVTQHDPAQPAARQLLTVLLPDAAAEAEAKAEVGAHTLVAVVDGDVLGIWRGGPDDTLVAAIAAAAARRAHDAAAVPAGSA